MGEGPHELRAQVCFVSELRRSGLLSAGSQGEQSPVDLLVSVMAGVT